MYCTSTVTIKSFEYDDELTMNIHENEMLEDGWIVSRKGMYVYCINESVEDKLYREYRYYHLDNFL